jgi:hypothetical protein
LYGAIASGLDELDELLPPLEKQLVQSKVLNDFYCWPESVNLNKSNSQFKNVTIKVQLVRNDIIEDPTRALQVK